MAKIHQLRRMAVIIAKLSDGRRLKPSDLLDSVRRSMSVVDDRDEDVSLRTLQRDIATIDELFHITIKCDASGYYHVAERDGISDEYESMLLNFELLSSIDSDSLLQKYVLSEHHRPAFQVDISEVLNAIRNSHPVEFDYTLFRHGNKMIRKSVKPYFLKESQQRWYLVGYDSDGKLKTFGMDRISSLSVSGDRTFRRKEDMDIPALFRECYGIWNDPDMPVEEIVLKYDSVDGAFLKTMPLHHTQEILSDTGEGITVRVRLRITNDFVMALLSRSRSLEVISPRHLRERIRDICAAALERNR
jgi:predicted DNA-binding transcriptional regulator YafY